jgi:hypothetical protein
VDIVGYIVLCCLELKDNPGTLPFDQYAYIDPELTWPSETAQQGLLRMLSYILQTLSSDRTFGPALNEPLRIAIPSKWIVPGLTSDFLIVVSSTPNLSRSCELTFGLSVYTFHSNDARVELALPCVGNYTEQRCAVPTRGGIPNVYEIVTAFQGLFLTGFYTCR